MSLRQLRRVRWAVRAALTLGIAASVSANVLHAQPNPIAQTIAAWPPIALLITLELVARVPVAKRLGWVRAGATLVIASIAAWVSYWHMAAVAAKYGETDASPYLLPLSVDGLIVVTSVSLVELAARIRLAEQPPAEPTPAPVNPAPLETASPAETAAQNGNGHKPELARRIAALTTLAETRDPDAAAAAAGVTRQTVQRYVTDAEKAAKKTRGGRRSPSPEEPKEQ